MALSVLGSVKAVGRPEAELAREVTTGTTKNRIINVPRTKDTAMNGDLSLSQVNCFFLDSLVSVECVCMNLLRILRFLGDDGSQT